MSRPTRPPGPPPDEDPQVPPPPPPQGRPQPRFTPRQPAPPGPPGPSAPPRESHPYRQPSQAAAPAAQPPPPPAPPPAQPTFTPRRDPGRNGVQRDGAPRDGAPRDGASRDGASRDGAPRDGGQRGRSGRHGAGNGAGRGPGRRDRDGRPRPTFTPREGYEPPPDGGRREDYPAAQTTFLPPVPAGYPQQSYTQPFAYPEAPERPLPRPAGQDRRPPPDDEGLAARILEVPPPGDDLGTGPQAIVTQPNLARSSQVMALGTLASRVTGFLRTFVLVAALGTAGLADAYNNSNTLPNTVYFLMLGGIFTSVVVPMLVRAAGQPVRREHHRPG